MEFLSSIQSNKQHLSKILSPEKSFDINTYSLKIGERDACIYFIDGLTKDEILQKLLQVFQGIKKEQMPENETKFSELFIPYGECTLLKNDHAMVTFLLSGMSCLFIDGYPICFGIDCRTYPARGVSEPEKEKVLRGSRDGFVETLIFNTALIRRRIRDPKLTIEISSVGEASHTDVAICYMNDRIDKTLLSTIKTRIKSLIVEALTMNQETLAECLFPNKWFNPFPKYKYSERPDTAAASLLKGHIIILVDNSPAAIIFPSSIFDIIEEADDYYFPPLTGTYLRISRYLTSFLTWLLTPTWILLLQNPSWIPECLSFINVKNEIYVPLIIQLLILEFAVDGLKLAAINTPSMLTTPLSVIAGIALGEYSVSSGWFNSECMLYMAFVVIASYSQSSFELGYALKFMRIIVLILTGLFGLWGYIAGILITLCSIAKNKTLAGKSYIYPLFPFNWKLLKYRLIRHYIPHSFRK